MEKFDITGTYLFQFGSQGSGNGQLNSPLGILVHDGKIYVSDDSNHCISVFQLDGQFSHIIGSGHLTYACVVAILQSVVMVSC